MKNKQTILNIVLSAVILLSLFSCSSPILSLEGESNAAYGLDDSRGSKTIYVTNTGKSSNSGSSYQDAMDIVTALSKANAGTTVLIKKGTYKIQYKSGKKNTIYIKNSGTSSSPITVKGDGGQVIIDFQFPEGKWVQDSYGFDVTGSYWYFKNIDITRAGYQGAYVKGNYNTFEDCNFYHNRNTGLEINKGGSYTTVKNCDAYNNYDPKKNGSMADGFGPKQKMGPGNVFIGCNAWGNSDDGYDCFDSNMKVVFKNCTANKNGTHDGNGNGFKLGGMKKKANHYLENCTANNNRKHGFHANSNPGPITLKNCKASGNGGNNFNM